MRIEINGKLIQSCLIKEYGIIFHYDNELHRILSLPTDLTDMKKTLETYKKEHEALGKTIQKITIYPVPNSTYCPPEVLHLKNDEHGNDIDRFFENPEPYIQKHLEWIIEGWLLRMKFLRMIKLFPNDLLNVLINDFEKTFEPILKDESKRNRRVDIH